MSRQNEEMFDAMIRIAGREAMRQDAESFPPEDELEITFTSKFDRRMKRLTEKYHRKSNRYFTKFMRFATACIAVATLLFTSAFAFVPSFRESVIKTVVEWTGISARFTFNDKEDTSNNSDGIRPTYIPEGFTEVDYWEGKATIEIIYANVDGKEISYWRGSAEGAKVSLDSEHGVYSKRIIRGFDAHVLTSNSEDYPSYIVFNDVLHAYTLSGYIAVEELVRIAETIPTK
jgi:hypothetical protein